jgi:Spy/CpxP family protein refolding chaperone
MKGTRVAALAVALVIAVTASAQGGGSPQGQGAGRGGRFNMLANIELTDAQKAQNEDIVEKYQPEMAKIREEMQAGGDRAALMKKSADIREKQSTEQRAILTSEQQVIFDKNVADAKARMEQMQRQAPPAI